jgi:3-methyladenine DNA glycosylase AlkD
MPYAPAGRGGKDMTKTNQVVSLLTMMGNAERADRCQGFFKTAPGEYGEGDRFLGIRVPAVRKQVRAFRGISLSSLEELLQSEWHEVRLFSLLALVDMFRRKPESDRVHVYEMYMENACRVNNWDLVDSSAPHIAGAYLWEQNKKPLYQFAEAESLWKRRIAIIATQYFIRKNSFSHTLQIADILLSNSEDLIHKAVGWMLREVGNRDLETEENFLKSRYKTMPRTTLRYAIEKFGEEKRHLYLKGLV